MSSELTRKPNFISMLRLFFSPSLLLIWKTTSWWTRLRTHVLGNNISGIWQQCVCERVRAKQAKSKRKWLTTFYENEHRPSNICLLFFIYWRPYLFLNFSMCDGKSQSKKKKKIIIIRCHIHFFFHFESTNILTWCMWSMRKVCVYVFSNSFSQFYRIKIA